MPYPELGNIKYTIAAPNKIYFSGKNKKIDKNIVLVACLFQLLIKIVIW